MDSTGWTFEVLRLGSLGFTAMAYDGRFYYFPDGRHVYVYSRGLELVNRIQIGHEVSALCYDYADGCFWATGHDGDICKLSQRFEVVDRIAFGDGVILGLSYFCAHDTLLVACKDAIAEVCKHGHKRGIGCATHSRYVNVLAVAPCFAIAKDRGGLQVIDFHGPSGAVLASLSVPHGYRVADMLFCHRESQLVALAFEHGKGHGRPVILRHPMPCLDVCECNFALPDPCVKDEHCKWIVSNASDAAPWWGELLSESPKL